MVTKKKPKPKAGSSMEGAANRRLVFAHAYIANGGNATEAAKAAGFSHKTAKVQGSRLLTHVDVSALIAQNAEKLAKKYDLHADMLVRSIVQEINFDPAKLFDRDGRLLPLSQMDEDTKAVLTSVEITEEEIKGAGKKTIGTLRTAKVKWAPKQGAREQGMKHLGMFKADNAQRSTMDGVPREVLLAIAARLKEMGTRV
jgi:phage terminase small subunit